MHTPRHGPVLCLPPRRYLDLEATRGGYEAAEASSDDLQRPCRALARLLGCSAEEIAVVSSATQAWQMVLYGFEFRRVTRAWVLRDRDDEPVCGAVCLLAPR